MIESVLRGIILQKAESPVAKTVVVDISNELQPMGLNGSYGTNA